MWDTTEEFFTLWDTMENFSSVVGYIGRGLFPLWDTTENNLRMANKFFFRCIPQRRSFSSVLSYTTTESYVMYYIPEKSYTFYPTTPQGGFLPLYPTIEDIFLRCGIQWKRFFPLWDTMEEVFLHCEIQWKRFFLLWDTVEKNDTMQNDIF